MVFCISFNVMSIAMVGRNLYMHAPDSGSLPKILLCFDLYFTSLIDIIFYFRNNYAPINCSFASPLYIRTTSQFKDQLIKIFGGKFSCYYNALLRLKEFSVKKHRASD